MACSCCGRPSEDGDLVYLTESPEIGVCDGCIDRLAREQHESNGALDVAPIFVTTDISRALRHYSDLGFETEPFADIYGFLRWGRASIHVACVRRVSPKKSDVACYLYVPDADEVHRRWSSSGVGGSFREPVDTDYGLREGAHIDPDGNLIRYGSKI